MVSRMVKSLEPLKETPWSNSNAKYMMEEAVWGVTGCQRITTRVGIYRGGHVQRTLAKL